MIPTRASFRKSVIYENEVPTKVCSFTCTVSLPPAQPAPQAQCPLSGEQTPSFWQVHLLAQPVPQLVLLQTLLHVGPEKPGLHLKAEKKRNRWPGRFRRAFPFWRCQDKASLSLTMGWGMCKYGEKKFARKWSRELSSPSDGTIQYWYTTLFRNFQPLTLMTSYNKQFKMMQVIFKNILSLCRE